MDMPSSPINTRAPGLFMRLLMKVAAVDEETLRLCPEQDWGNVRAVGEILICTWLYQTGLFCLITHKLFAMPGQIRPELILASMFLSSFIIAIDSYMFMRSGWHLSGISELKRGGLDISGGAVARIKAGFFLAIRIGLSIGLAQLTAIFLSLVIFAADIRAPIEAAYLKANASLAEAATALVDDDIKRMKGAVADQTTRVANLSAQITAMRQNEIDPANPQLQQAQQEVAQLLDQKTKADNAQQAAEIFASNEAGGIKGAPGNSGKPGRKARYKAALEQAANAQRHADAAAQGVDAARVRLDALRERLSTANDALMQRSRDRLPDFEAKLTTEEAKLSELKRQLAALTDNREEAIRKAVENAPDHVARDDGLLSQLAILKQIADGDQSIKAVIVLIDITSFGFELAAVLVKITSYVPTSYAAMLARDAYLRVIHMVEEMMSDLGAKADTASSSTHVPLTNPEATSTEQQADDNPFEAAGTAVEPPKRSRGRPRKNVENATLGDAAL